MSVPATPHAPRRATAVIVLALGALLGSGSGVLAQEPSASAAPSPVASPLPSESPYPEPSFVGDTELAALFPSAIAGQPVAVQTFTGQELLDASGDDASAAEIEAFLTGLGKTIDDLSYGFAYVTGANDSYAMLYAMRVKGTTADEILMGLMPLFTQGFEDPQTQSLQVADKTLTVISDGPYTSDGDYEYVYPQGEIIWGVAADEPLLSEIVAALP